MRCKVIGGDENFEDTVKTMASDVFGRSANGDLVVVGVGDVLDKVKMGQIFMVCGGGQLEGVPAKREVDLVFIGSRNIGNNFQIVCITIHGR